MSNNELFYKFLKTNSTIPIYYIEAKTSDKLYAILEQSGGDEDGLELCNSSGSTSTFLISVFSSSYTKGINERQNMKQLIKNSVGFTYKGLKIDLVKLLGEWDTEKLNNGLYSFNIEYEIKTS